MFDHLEILRQHNLWRRGDIDETPNSPTEIGMAIDWAIGEIEARRLKVDTLTEWYANAMNVINECSAVLPGAHYMDPPDGGDVSIPEQLRRMARDAERYQWLRDSSESIHQFYLSTPIWFTGVKFSKENVDRTIDASKGGRDDA